MVRACGTTLADRGSPPMTQGQLSQGNCEKSEEKESHDHDHLAARCRCTSENARGESGSTGAHQPYWRRWSTADVDVAGLHPGWHERGRTFSYELRTQDQEVR